MICNPSKLNNYPRPEEIALIRQRQQQQRTIKIMWALCFNATKISIFRNYSHFLINVSSFNFFCPSFAIAQLFIAFYWVCRHAISSRPWFWNQSRGNKYPLYSYKSTVFDNFCLILQFFLLAVCNGSCLQVFSVNKCLLFC